MQLFNGRPAVGLTSPAAASALAVTGRSAFYGIIVRTDGVNAVTLNVYDNTEASGSKLIPTDTVIPGNVNLAMIEFGTPILAENGIYVSASVAGGGSASYQVQYDQ